MLLTTHAEGCKFFASMQNGKMANIGLQRSDLFYIRNTFTWPILLNRKTSGSLSKTQSEYFYPLFPYRLAAYGLEYKHHRLAHGICGESGTGT